ncbi:helix-turn-helix transcriptional regulator [Brucella pseudogrignonensis]|uniref:helix-turn-helix transcriptional regulator n=1 Tax=Brucella pseudogrignonensis TaxID=419475 RepID=UPI0028B5FC76|nr:helix-turn-helix transcriptional regulator [Brucella pseudogrignonensis]MDT6942303.1 helix-turn-helix transcriptional regulator [Brucella pseudogrignonensis]
MLSNSEAQINELVAGIYAALLGEQDWQSFLDRLNNVTPGALSTLFFHDYRANIGAVAYVSGVEGRERALNDYEGYYSNLNPWMRRVAATPVGRGIVGEEIISREEFNRSEYYSDYIRPNGLETGVGLTLFKDQNCYFLLSTLTDDTDIDRNLDRANVLTRIAPHLQRVFRYYRSGEFHTAAIDFGKGIDMATGLAFMLINEDLRVIKASAVAELALSSGKVAGLDPLGRIRFANPDIQSALRSLLVRQQGIRETKVFNDLGSGVRFIRIGGSPAVEFFAGPMVAVLMGEGSAAGRVSGLAQIAASYRLSPAETRVFVGIVNGLSLSDIADQSNVTRETVRSQLKSIFSKTGASSQMDLVRLGASSAPSI